MRSGIDAARGQIIAHGLGPAGAEGEIVLLGCHARPA